MNDPMPRRAFLRMGLLSGAALGLAAPALARAAAAACVNNTEMLGPYYLPNARFETLTGSGLQISGVVRDEETCQPIQGAIIERWHSNPYGVYEDYYRCRMVSDSSGRYAFQTHMPGIYGARPRHVHYRVTAPGYKELITQNYFPQEQAGGVPEPVLVFDLVMQQA